MKIYFSFFMSVHWVQLHMVAGRGRQIRWLYRPLGATDVGNGALNLGALEEQQALLNTELSLQPPPPKHLILSVSDDLLIQSWPSASLAQNHLFLIWRVWIASQGVCLRNASKLPKNAQPFLVALNTAKAFGKCGNWDAPDAFQGLIVFWGHSLYDP